MSACLFTSHAIRVLTRRVTMRGFQSTLPYWRSSSHSLFPVRKPSLYSDGGPGLLRIGAHHNSVALYFGFVYIVWMHQTLSIYIPNYSCGGMMWPRVFIRYRKRTHAIVPENLFRKTTTHTWKQRGGWPALEPEPNLSWVLKFHA